MTLRPRLFATLALLAFCASALAAEPVKLLVAHAETVVDAATGEPVLDIKLTPEGARSFAALTSASVGKTLALRIDGTVVATPKLLDPILGGEVRVSGSFGADELRSIASRISSGTAQVEVEVEN